MVGSKALRKVEYSDFHIFAKFETWNILYILYTEYIVSKLNFYFCDTLILTQILIEYMITIKECRPLVGSCKLINI